MRLDELYLRDLLAAAFSIRKFLHGVEEREFLQDKLLQSAVLQKLTVIGEAAARPSDDLRSKHAQVDDVAQPDDRPPLGYQDPFANRRHPRWRVTKAEWPAARRTPSRYLVPRDVDASDKWYYIAYDRILRWVATFRDSDTSPTEEFVYQAAGYEGVGSGSFIDLVLFRDKDANTAWTTGACDSGY